ncbi:hypothetical protein LCGC14_0790050 [marine sediment metagenome]|uniref:Uncharacterized protein n=1 Tax=marine sediment metagenome TaxID=412755 RepID=A0A0F9PT12_9ZZZZ
MQRAQPTLQDYLARVRLAGQPGQAAQPGQLDIGDIVRRLMNIQPRSYFNLLPSDRAGLAGDVSQLGVPPEDFFASVERQFPRGVNPAGISFGAGF